jgi:phosphatidate cytidylyltransferase
MLKWRLIVGPLLVAAAVGLLSVDARMGDSAPLLWLLCMALVLRGVWELDQLFKTRSFETRYALPAVCSVVIVTANWLPHWLGDLVPEIRPLGLLGPAYLAFGVSVMVLFVEAAGRYRGPGRTMETLGAELLMICYIGVLMSLTIQLRWVGTPDLGYTPFGSLIVVAKAGDIAAYFAGRAFGRSKLVPHLSPGKTWAGFRGAVIGSVLASCVWFGLIVPAYLPTYTVPPGWAMLLYGLMIGLAGLVGDLCESLIKRDVGKKDSGALLPGFGGLLDLLDSILFPGPLAFVLWLLLPLR